MLPLPLSRLAELIKVRSSSSELVYRVSLNSKEVQKGDLFFAFKGEKVDGLNFLQEAASKGAVGAVVPNYYKGQDFGLTLLPVMDPLDALQTLAKQFLKMHMPRIIGITGSIGKTTTKEFTKTLLEEKFKVGATPGNANSQLGLPLSIVNLKGDEEILVIEMGMSEAKQIEALTQVAPPDIALITHITHVHAAFFDSLEAIARAKLEIFAHPKTSMRIYNQDMPCQEVVKEALRGKVTTYSTLDKSATLYLENRDNEITVFFQGKEVIRSMWPLLAKHHLINFLGAVSIAHACGMNFQAIAKRIAFLKLPPQRFELIEKQGITFINDAYNATEKSVVGALESLPHPKKGGKKIAVLGDMRELGKFSYELHHKVGKKALLHVDLLLCLGNSCKVMEELWKEAKKEVYYFESKDKLIECLKERVAVGDVVLVKGARVHALEEILDSFSL